MVEIISPEYQGPERRKTFYVSDTCPCHTKHDAILKRHDAEIDLIRREDMGKMWEDIKSRTPYRLFLAAVLIFVAMAGVTYKKAHEIDIKVEKNIVRMQVMQENLQEIKSSIKSIDDAIEQYIEDWRRENGFNKKKGGK